MERRAPLRRSAARIIHVLFVHRAGVGQFAALIGNLVAEGVEVTLITERPAQEAPGVRQFVHSVDESTTRHPELAATEYHLRTGEAVARLLERLKRSDPPDALFVVVGGDGAGYGRPRSDGNSWREAMLAETGLGERIVHIPWLAYENLIRLFQVSAVHVYLTVPFVLSWSLLEAMACGCLVVGSDTDPVKEVVRDSSNGLLAPFHDAAGLAERIDEALSGPAWARPLRRAARETVMAGYERERCIARQTGWIRQFGD